MKRLILIALCFLCCTTAHACDVINTFDGACYSHQPERLAWMGVVGVGGGVATAQDLNDIIFHVTADGSIASTTYTKADSECGPNGTVASVAAVNADAKKIGAKGFDFPSTADYITFNLGTAYNAGKFSMAFWYRSYAASLTSSATVSYACFGYSDFSRYACFGMSDIGGGQIEPWVDYRENGGTIRSAQTDECNLQVATWYLIVIDVNEDTPVIKISIYNESYTLIDSASYTSSFDDPNTGFQYVRIGAIGTADDFYIDNVIISDLSVSRNLVSDTIGGTRIVALDTCPNN